MENIETPAQPVSSQTVDKPGNIQSTGSGKSTMAIISLVLGIVGLCA